MKARSQGFGATQTDRHLLLRSLVTLLVLLSCSTPVWGMGVRTVPAAPGCWEAVCGESPVASEHVNSLDRVHILVNPLDVWGS